VLVVFRLQEVCDKRRANPKHEERISLGNIRVPLIKQRMSYALFVACVTVEFHESIFKRLMHWVRLVQGLHRSRETTCLSSLVKDDSFDCVDAFPNRVCIGTGCQVR